MAAPSSSLLTIGMITNEAVRLFTNSNAFMRTIDKQYSDQFARSGAKIGATVNARLPMDFTVGTGPAITPQGVTEQQVPVTLTTQANVPISFTTQDRTLSIDEYSERVLAPAINKLAAKVAVDIMGVANLSSNITSRSVSGSLVSPDASTYLSAKAILDKQSAPAGNRHVILDPLTEARTVSSLAGLFNPQRKISDQFEEGVMTYDTLGFNTWAQDQTIPVHTVGSFSAGTVNGAGQTGNTLVVNAITGTLNKGDIITIANVNSVNRLTGGTDGTVRQFVVTANVANGATSIPIYPAIVAAGNAYQTVDSLPANGAAISLVMTASSQYRANLAYFSNAFTFATADLVMPTQGVVESARAVFDGVAMRTITGYDVRTDELITRIDVLYGVAALRGEWSCIVADIL